MTSWGKAIGLGVLSWLIPFVVAVVAFPWRESVRPLFESVMAVTVTGTAAGLGLAYLRWCPNARVREGLSLGLVWFGICVLIDAPLMLLGGPMYMSIGTYLADIGLTYASIPLVTWGLAAARSASASRSGHIGPG
jgi:hypothetical protein